ncbi:2-hydroxy-3-oxopropionate reductase [Candidatus Phycosocius bacilliformis]|uniref:2-hydroxy-3-oxopropionate reductase n=1 Tax=Candidatus Phycosocius bacilliformis TaxID=1445552 RepID=A0A2P2E854_9PROT|nr:NAD(P)-dependent oxidoreductase [Candidatus Phycosocius bacilliformis]GBF57227.1 2-hydroxy-3-oxopropionate reductase [Candidatus Phycosocius bacilliformis]
MSGSQVAFLGLGVMGGPMAGWLVQKGHQVRAWNRSPGKAESWASAHAVRPSSSIAQAVDGADMVLACVGDDPDARAVAEAAFTHMRAGAIYIDHTTTSAALASDLSKQAHNRGLGWVDAPVSGGQAGAVNGRLTAMCGATEADFSAAHPVMSAYCATIVRIGEAGTGQLTKMVNQIAIAGVVQGLAEAMAFAKAQGLDTDAVLAAISKGAAGSWQMDNRWVSMAEDRFDFGFAVDWMRKDLRIVLEAAEAKGLTLELTKLVDGYYGEIQAAGGGRLDTSSLARRFRHAGKAEE